MLNLTMLIRCYRRIHSLILFQADIDFFLFLLFIIINQLFREY